MPSERASLSPSGSRDSPTVVPSVFAPVPPGGIGAQFVGGKAVGGEACVEGGVVGAAGACACAAAPKAATHDAMMKGLVRMS